MQRFYSRVFVCLLACLAASSVARAGEPRPEGRRIFHILVAKRFEALEIRKEVIAGGETLSAFRAAARKHSKDVATKFLGGELGWFGPEARLDRELLDAAFRLPLEKVSEPLRTTRGWHVIYVSEIRGEPSSAKARKAEPGAKAPEGDLAVPASDEAAVAIVERYLEACGGREAFAAIRDRRTSFRYEKIVPGGENTVVEIRLFLKEGYKVREEWDVKGHEWKGMPLSFVQGYDGADGWVSMLGKVSSLEGKTLQVFVWDKELQDFFFHWKEDGYSLKSAGKEKLGDEDVDLVDAAHLSGAPPAVCLFFEDWAPPPEGVGGFGREEGASLQGLSLRPSLRLAQAAAGADALGVPRQRGARFGADSRGGLFQSGPRRRTFREAESAGAVSGAIAD